MPSSLLFSSLVFLIKSTLFLFARACQHPPNSGRKSSSDERCHDEQPELRQGFASCENSRSNRAGRIDRSSCNRDTYDMYQRKCQANGQASEGAGTFFLIGSPQYDQHENKCEDRLSDKKPATSLLHRKHSPLSKSTHRRLLSKSAHRESPNRSAHRSPEKACTSQRPCRSFASKAIHPA